MSAASVVRPARACLSEAVAVFRRRPGIVAMAILAMWTLGGLAILTGTAWVATQGGCAYRPDEVLLVANGTSVRPFLSGWSYNCSAITFLTMPWAPVGAVIWMNWTGQGWARVLAGRAAGLDMRRDLFTLRGVLWLAAKHSMSSLGGLSRRALVDAITFGPRMLMWALTGPPSTLIRWSFLHGVLTRSRHNSVEVAITGGAVKQGQPSAKLVLRHGSRVGSECTDTNSRMCETTARSLLLNRR